MGRSEISKDQQKKLSNSKGLSSSSTLRMLSIKSPATFVTLSSPKWTHLRKNRAFPSRTFCCASATAQTSLSSISNLTDSVRNRDTTATKTLENTLHRISAINPHINAFLTIDAESAYSQAKAVDSAIADGRDPGPLCGVPICVKDNICTQNITTTGGSKILDGFVPAYDAAVIERLRNAGAIIVGKTNLDEFGMGSSTELSGFGPTRNPLDLSTVPGGSSGGSAAAIAAGLCAAGLGSDTGGSIRQPAAFCGVTGIRPSYGLVPRYGLLAYASSFDTIGPIANSVSDAALVLSVIAGRHAQDATSIDAPKLEAPRATSSCEGLRIGVISNALDFQSGDTKVDDEIVLAIRQAATVLSDDLGASVSDIELPILDACVAPYYTLAMSEASANLARYDGIRYGVRDVEASTCDDVFARSRSRGLGPEVKRRILAGTFSLSSGYVDAYYTRAQRIRRRVSDELTSVFEQGQFHALITPVAPSPAFKFGKCQDDPLFMYLNDIMSLPASLAGIPAVSVPCGFTASGMPIGLQIMAPYLRDDLAIKIAHAYQIATSHHTKTSDLVEKAIVTWK